MKKYVIVETWNGQDYSESTAKIEEFESDWKAQQKIKELAIETANAHDNFVEVSAKTNCATYTYFYGDENEDGTFDDGEDHGSFQFFELKGQYAVVINPMINEYRIIETRLDFEHQLNQWKKDAQDDEQLRNLDSENFSSCFDCLEDGDVIVVKLPMHVNLSDYDIIGGDGVEYEVWEHKATGSLIKIPIEIVRDLDNIEEL